MDPRSRKDRSLTECRKEHKLRGLLHSDSDTGYPCWLVYPGAGALHSEPALCQVKDLQLTSSLPLTPTKPVS